MRVVAFGDESGIHSGGYRCYGIGAFLVTEDALGTAATELDAVWDRFSFSHELKWSSIGNFRAGIEVAVAGVGTLLALGAGFQAIIVNKPKYSLWNSGDRETAFYKTYFQIAKSISKFGETRLMIDDRSDRYAHRAEVLQKITNHALAKMQASGAVSEVVKVNSKNHRVLQLADIVVGAITSDTNRFLGGRTVPNDGKAEVIARVAHLFEWDALHYETWPGEWLNIWHFPVESRSRAATRRIRLNVPAA